MNTLKRQHDKDEEEGSTSREVKRQRKGDSPLSTDEVFDDTPYILITVEQLSMELWYTYTKYNPLQTDKKGRMVLDYLLSRQGSKHVPTLEEGLKLFYLLDKWFSTYHDMDEEDTDMYYWEHQKLLKKISEIVQCGDLERSDLKQFEWNISKKDTINVKCYVRMIEGNTE
jgi:hypothetical protein